jgi:small subunit ribosomal protein S2
MALNVSPQDLLRAGVHFGHSVSRWNPRMKPFIYGKRNLIHIIDLKSTLRGLVRAYHFIERVAARGDLVLFVGTKRQCQGVVESEAKRCGMPYVSERWLGGTLTNYSTIRMRLQRLNEIETMEKDGTINVYNKKEIAAIQRQKRKLRQNLEGLRTLERLPTALILVDPTHEAIAIQEADRVKAATLCLIDTDGDPNVADIIIPCNDDSFRVVRLILGQLADAVLAGRAKCPPAVKASAAPATTAAASGAPRAKPPTIAAPTAKPPAPTAKPAVTAPPPAPHAVEKPAVKAPTKPAAAKPATG